MPRKFVRRASLVASAALLVACGWGAAQTRERAQQQPQTPPAAVQEQLGHGPQQSSGGAAQALSASFRGASAKALPAVVFIQVEKKASAAEQEQENQLPEPFRRFFGVPPGGEGGEEQPVAGAGSGFILDTQGHVITNNHVVSDTDQVLVRLVDGREYTAKVLGSDEQTDVAVLKIDPRPGETLPVSQLGNSDDISVGDWVLALGSPLELRFTVTAGIVSAKGRQLTGNPSNLEAFIQTDAAINPGNSGGPLVDIDGRVIGINSAIFGGQRFVGYGFAIPINIAHKAVDDILQYGHVRRPQIGVQIQSVSEADAEVYHLPSIAGAEVVSVVAGSPAAKAGVKIGDVVVNVDGKPVHDATDLTTGLAQHQPGDRVTLGVFRNGQRQDVAVTLGEFTHEAESAPAPKEKHAVEEALGFRVEPLTPEIARQADLDRTSGVVISQVSPLSGAASAGVQRGWMVTAINGQEVKTVADVERIAATVKQGQVVSLRAYNKQSGDLIVNYRARR
jgi:serine protease Do